ncbi:MAG TPA: porin [Gemmatimonadales bacterium]|nr:porin [Gemmatimonadales bacterium]
MRPHLVLATVLVAVMPTMSRAQGTARLTGYLQPRFQALGDTASFFLRRARFAVEGNITPWASYRAQVEMRTIGAAATPSSSPLTLSATDLWVKLSHLRWTGTAGQFRVPFSLESLLSSTTLETTERSRIVNAAKRDIGAQIEWRIPDRVTLQASVVNGEGPNRATNPDNRMAYFARAIVTPLKALDIGGAFEGYSDSTGLNGQAMYHGKRWSARAEYIYAMNRRTDVLVRGWYALAAFRPTPQHVQLVGRVEQFDPNNTVATDRSTGYLVGLQYFIRGDDFKLLSDYEVFHEQVTQVKNNRGVIQMQVRW